MEKRTPNAAHDAGSPAGIISMIGVLFLLLPLKGPEHHEHDCVAVSGDGQICLHA